jgi:hypothetical protein
MSTLMNEHSACFLGWPTVALGVYIIGHSAAKGKATGTEWGQVQQHPLLWAGAYGAGVNRGARVP